MISVSENPKYLGNMRSGESRTFVLYVSTNQEEEKVEITRISCGLCTTARLSSNIVKKNQRVTLTITFTPGNTGINRKSIVLNDNLIVNFSAQVS